MSGGIHLFVYGALKSGGEESAVLAGSRLVGPATVAGTLYQTPSGYPALMLAGAGRVHGEIWNCAPEILRELDAYEGVEDGLFRRVGVRVGDHACWTYVAGPRLARALTPDRRIPSGDWSPRPRP
jgi:gamma-glutamylcyclotransferase (GGCT)/AIG2-like uncharacterized protein YtfP